MNLKSAQKKKFRGFTLKRKLINLNYGFTLIELLITIGIMGILAAAVLVAINPVKRQNSAKDANLKNDIVNIATALQTYYTTKSSYTASQANLVTNGDLTAQISPASYTITVAPGGCEATVPPSCTGVSVSGTLLDGDPLVPGDLWCFRSSTGKAAESSTCPAP